MSLYLPTKSGAKEPGDGAWDWQVHQMVNLKARLQKLREKAELGRHDKRVLEHLEQLDTQKMEAREVQQRLSVWHCWIWLRI